MSKWLWLVQDRIQELNKLAAVKASEMEFQELNNINSILEINHKVLALLGGKLPSNTVH